MESAFPDSRIPLESVWSPLKNVSSELIIPTLSLPSFSSEHPGCCSHPSSVQRPLDGGEGNIGEAQVDNFHFLPCWRAEGWGLFPSWRPLVLPSHSLPGSPRIPALCQDPVMRWIRPGGSSTPQGVARVGHQGVRGMNPPCSRYPPRIPRIWGSPQQCHLHSFLTSGRSWESPRWGELRDATTFSLPSETSQPLYLDHSQFWDAFTRTCSNRGMQQPNPVVWLPVLLRRHGGNWDGPGEPGGGERGHESVHGAL